MSLLVHITYHDHSDHGDAQMLQSVLPKQDPTAAADTSLAIPAASNTTLLLNANDTTRSGIIPHNWIILRKSSRTWRDHVFSLLTANLQAIDSGYARLFSSVDVVVDVNDGNAYADRLRNVAARLRFARVVVHSHEELDTPFHLAWTPHRKHMTSRLSDYDWFMYTEEDTFVPATALREQLRLQETLFAKTGKLLSFVRVANNTRGILYFADLGRRSTPESLFSVPSLGKFGSLSFSFSASWAYSRRLMELFVNSSEWHNPKSSDLRASAGTGFSQPPGCASGSRCVVVTAPSAANLRVYHLARCGRFYVRTPSTCVPFCGGKGWLIRC